MLLSTVILYGALLACAAVAAWIARQYDLYDHEPWKVLLLCAALGAGCMFAAGKTEELVIQRLTDRGHPITDDEFALLAGVTEEAAKFLGVLAVAVFFRRKFNDPLDGIVYGSFVGLGAALEESVAVLRDADPSRFLPPQEPIRIAGHLVMGGIGAFGLGLFTLHGARRWHALWAAPLCLAGAMALHTLWDVHAFRAALEFREFDRLETRRTLIPVVLMLGGLGGYKLLVAVGAALSRHKGQFCDVKTKRCPPPLKEI